MKKLTFLLMSLLSPIILLAENTGTENVEMADTWRSNGKIYVVIGCIAIIFIGLIIQLISLERRLRKIEKENSQEGGNE